MYQVVNGKWVESKRGNIFVKYNMEVYPSLPKKWTTFQEITIDVQDTRFFFFFLVDFSSSKIKGGRWRENTYWLPRSSDCDSTIMSLTKISNPPGICEQQQKLKECTFYGSIGRKSSNSILNENICELRTWILTGKLKGEGKHWGWPMSLEIHLV